MHPAKKVILDTFLDLADRLASFEQTTHGYIGSRDIQGVATALEQCYRDPTSFSISNLSQAIRCLHRDIK